MGKFGLVKGSVPAAVQLNLAGLWDTDENDAGVFQFVHVNGRGIRSRYDFKAQSFN